ncbi:hypothetical protein GW17_00033995, partial [Ensete ventricosum]
MSHLVGLDRRTSAYNMLLCDALMLENQIPLFLLQKALGMQCSSSQIAAQVSSSMLIGFLIEVSPFKTLDISPWIDAGQHAHLLELLYQTVAPNPEELFETIEGNEENEEEPQVYVRIRFFLKAIAAFIFNRGRALVSAVVKFLVTIPWRTIKSIPALSIIAHPVEQLLSSQKDQNSEPARGISTHDRSTTPLLEEIAIPSVTELTKAGVKFSAMNGDISAIEFDAQTATLHLPTISLDVNAEVVLRNLVAYEASIGSRPLIVSRYVELMNGIIDTAEDAKLLREAGVVLNHLKSDEEVAELWNSMTRSVRLTRVPALDRVIEEVFTDLSDRKKTHMTAQYMRSDSVSVEQALLVQARVGYLVRDCLGTYNGYGAPVPEVLIAPVAYRVVVLRRGFRGPRGEVRGVPPAIGEGRSCLPYLCQVGRMMADPPIFVSGRAQLRQVGHVVGPAVRGRRDVAARSTF